MDKLRVSPIRAEKTREAGVRSAFSRGPAHFATSVRPTLKIRIINGSRIGSGQKIVRYTVYDGSLLSVRRFFGRQLRERLEERREGHLRAPAPVD